MRIFYIFAFLFLSVGAFPAKFLQVKAHHAPPDLLLFEKCYPDIEFSKKWDSQKNDWKISLTVSKTPDSIQKKTEDFFWAGGKMLPESELQNKDEWWSLLYHYDAELRDPKTFTEDEIEELKIYGSKESRQTTAGSPMFFFDFLYDCYSELKIEQHIKKTTFLGKKTKIHERIAKPLARVEKKIMAHKNDLDVKKFLDTLSTTDAYFWRTIANTSRKSFHSYGIAIDILPKRLYGKETYWSWAKDSRGDRWMLTPLNQRWSPPRIVVDAFESEGFVWGGKWAIWDTMHFEYHPELIAFNKIKAKL